MARIDNSRRNRRAGQPLIAQPAHINVNDATRNSFHTSAFCVEGFRARTAARPKAATKATQIAARLSCSIRGRGPRSIRAFNTRHFSILRAVACRNGRVSSRATFAGPTAVVGSSALLARPLVRRRSSARRIRTLRRCSRTSCNSHGANHGATRRSRRPTTRARTSSTAIDGGSALVGWRRDRRHCAAASSPACPAAVFRMIAVGHAINTVDLRGTAVISAASGARHGHCRSHLLNQPHQHCEPVPRCDRRGHAARVAS
mmetsp:Transcript_24062/g.83517  ORF Transcript_24062/g.83517 Transcript_24062/m.83517 type:complete len:259 (+) Transcript_24062:422-1198(+)